MGSVDNRALMKVCQLVTVRPVVACNCGNSSRCLLDRPLRRNKVRKWVLGPFLAVGDDAAIQTSSLLDNPINDSG